ncbi:MAG: hypothetical protein WC011_04310 [Candidatus Paceibacterota bacterium]
MSKQKIILFISILILLGVIVGFYFYVISQKVEIDPEVVTPDPKAIFEEKVQNELNSFQTPTTETVVPRPAPDQTIKDDTEVKAEIDSYVVPDKKLKDPENEGAKSNQDILDLLNNPNFKAY